MNQRTQVLEHLREGNSITSMDAIRYFGITRISAKIFELRNEGYDIERKNITVFDKFGRRKTFGRWSLVNTEPSHIEQMKLGDF